MSDYITKEEYDKYLTGKDEYFKTHFLNAYYYSKGMPHGYGFCPFGHPYLEDTIRIEAINPNIKTGDKIYPKRYCNVCDKWFPDHIPLTVSEINND